MTLVFTSYCKITSSSSDVSFCEYLLERCSGFLASSLVIQGYAELQLAHQKIKDELVSQEHQNREFARLESEAKAREDTVLNRAPDENIRSCLSQQSLARGKTTESFRV